MSKNLLLFFFLLPVFVGAQNLVFNPSFEDTTACPSQEGFISYSLGWHSYGNTPDYFNSCTNSSDVDVPGNEFGNQNPLTGNAYAGVIAFYTNYREIIGSQLLSPLEIGIKYYVSIKVSLAGKSLFATDKIGINFSTVQYNDLSTPSPINNQAEIYSSSIITDTTNWINISGSFIADSAYQFIEIGNFFDDLNIDTLRVLDVAASNYIFNSYYYIDNVCVSPDSATCNSDVGLNPIVKPVLSVYPNPVSDKICINYNSGFEINLSLYSVLGKKLKSLVEHENFTLDVSDVPAGLYIIRFKYEGSTFQKKIIIIH